jgi:hypothetical protein
MSRLRYGDLVRNEDGMHGILVTEPGVDTATVGVAFGNGLEELVSLARLASVPLIAAGVQREPRANFREWIVPREQPVTRAIHAFAGRDALGTSFDIDGAILGLILSLARVVATMPEERFDDITKAEFVESIARMLKHGGNDADGRGVSGSNGRDGRGNATDPH